MIRSQVETDRDWWERRRDEEDDAHALLFELGDRRGVKGDAEERKAVVRARGGEAEAWDRLRYDFGRRAAERDHVDGPALRLAADPIDGMQESERGECPGLLGLGGKDRGV